MCLAVLALRPTSLTSLTPWNWIVVANRDESHERPSAPMQPWSDSPDILAGQDLRAGGGWLGVHRDGRFALLTNYREPGFKRDDAPSRGQLMEQFLKQTLHPQTYLQALQPESQRYNGFNLLLSAQNQWWHASNRMTPFLQAIEPVCSTHNPNQAAPKNKPDDIRVFGLSNALFNTPWPKVIKTREGVHNVLSQATDWNQPEEISTQLVAVFKDNEPASDDSLPNTGLSLDRERLLSSPFIQSPNYGTRCTTVVMQLGNADLWVQEINYQPDGTQSRQSTWLSRSGQAWQRLS